MSVEVSLDDGSSWDSPCTFVLSWLESMMETPMENEEKDKLASGQVCYVQQVAGSVSFGLAAQVRQTEAPLPA